MLERGDAENIKFRADRVGIEMLCVVVAERAVYETDQSRGVGDEISNVYRLDIFSVFLLTQARRAVESLL